MACINESDLLKHVQYDADKLYNVTGAMKGTSPGGVLRYISDGDVEALFWVSNLRSEDFFGV